ncbi:MAG TPA: FkbM family methyltransferase [Chitinophagaceae bacterium]|nr:FkbM family methyltransferase [Chitinophagaceae bacterium]
MLKKIESIINQSPFYNIIRFNFIADLIVELKTRRTRKAIKFFSSFLGPSSENKLIYDIGANKGSKVKAFLKMGYKVVAVEPERRALSTLRWRFGRNKNVIILGKGVSDKESTLTIHVAEARSGLNTLSDKWVKTLEKEEENRWHRKHAFNKSYEVEVTTLDNLFNDYGLPFFIKIDVEGYEKNVIKGMSRMPGFVSFETNLPEFLDESRFCIEHIAQQSVNTLYNYSFTDRLHASKWLSKEEMLNVLHDPSVRYMEIICRNAIKKD